MITVKTTVSYQTARQMMTPESEKAFLKEARGIAEAGTLSPGISHVQIYILDPAMEVDTRGSISMNLSLNVALLRAMGKEGFVRFAKEYHGMYLYISFSKLGRIERDELILRDYERGLSSAQIGLKFNLSAACVRKIVQRKKP